MPIIIGVPEKFKQRLFWTSKDERSLCEILDAALEHYRGFKKTDDSGQKFAYLFEIFTLMDHLLLIRLASVGKKSDLADSTRDMMLETGEHFFDYSEHHLGFLVYVADKLDRSVLDKNTLLECGYRLDRIKRDHPD
jgi:hypothetical protein